VTDDRHRPRGERLLPPLDLTIAGETLQAERSAAEVRLAGGQDDLRIGRRSASADLHDDPLVEPSLAFRAVEVDQTDFLLLVRSQGHHDWEAHRGLDGLQRVTVERPADRHDRHEACARTDDHEDDVLPLAPRCHHREDEAADGTDEDTGSSPAPHHRCQPLEEPGVLQPRALLYLDQLRGAIDTLLHVAVLGDRDSDPLLPRDLPDAIPGGLVLRTGLVERQEVPTEVSVLLGVDLDQLGAGAEVGGGQLLGVRDHHPFAHSSLPGDGPLVRELPDLLPVGVGHRVVGERVGHRVDPHGEGDHEHGQQDAGQQLGLGRGLGHTLVREPEGGQESAYHEQEAAQEHDVVLEVQADRVGVGHEAHPHDRTPPGEQDQDLAHGVTRLPVLDLGQGVEAQAGTVRHQEQREGQEGVEQRQVREPGREGQGNEGQEGDDEDDDPADAQGLAECVPVHVDVSVGVLFQVFESLQGFSYLRR